MIVYIVTFPNKKKYVGATSRTIEIRKSDHLSACSAGVSNKFYNAVRKYGWDSLSWEIHSKHNSIESMFEAEINLIKSLNTQTSGYNTTAGGQGCPGRIRSDEEREKISIAQQIRFSRPEEREKARQYAASWKDRDPEAFIQACIKRNNTLKKKEVRESISETLKRYFELPEAKEKLSKQANRVYLERPEVREKISRSLGGKPVSVWKDGELVIIYRTLSECSRETGISIGNIGMVLNGKRNHAGGFTFTREAA